MKASIRFFGSLLFIVVSFFALFSFAMFQGGFVSWFLFYSFLPILIYHLLLLFIPLKKWNVTRTLDRHWLHAGEAVQGKIVLERKVRFPIFYVVLEERLPSTLHRKYRKKDQLARLNETKQAEVKRVIKEIVQIGFRKRVEISYTLKELPRGIHELGEIRVLISDIFGFVRKEHIFPLKDELIVQPNVWDIQFIDKAPRLNQGQASIEHFLLKETNTVNGIREYAPGDRFSWVDWKQTAKKQTIMTKEFEQEKSDHSLLILDASRSNKRNPNAFEASIELTATFLAKVVKRSRDVEFLTLGSEVRNFDLKETHQVKHHLTQLQPGGEKSFSLQLEELLERTFLLDEVVIFTTKIDDIILNVTKTLRFRRTHLVIFYFQGSHIITEDEKNWMEEMKSDGVALHVLTEEDWDKIPLEVSV